MIVDTEMLLRDQISAFKTSVSHFIRSKLPIISHENVSNFKSFSCIF